MDAAALHSPANASVFAMSAKTAFRVSGGNLAELIEMLRDGRP
jgi:hypothetical protein